MNFTRGDIPQPTAFTLAGAPNLTSATVVATLKRVGTAGAVIFSRTATGNGSGVVTVTWQAGDFNAIGTYAIEFQSTASGVITTYPGGWITVRPDLDGTPVDPLAATYRVELEQDPDHPGLYFVPVPTST